jgi:hypothetical protein
VLSFFPSTPLARLSGRCSANILSIHSSLLVALVTLLTTSPAFPTWADADGAASTTTSSANSPLIVADASSVTELQPLVVNGRNQVNGPKLSPAGSSDYGVTDQDILALPTAGGASLTDVLLQMPGVALDQNQQIHIRDTEGPQFQYQINGVLVPLDINTNPPFLSMINPMFIKKLDLLDGVLPARYSYATGGVVDIETKDGCDGAAGGSLGFTGGQRETIQPSLQFGGCAGKFGFYVSGLYDQGETAFSSATPGPEPIHDFTRQGQAFGVFSYTLDSATKVSLIVSASASDNQLPNIPGLPPQFSLAGAPAATSANINSYLNFRDYLAIASLSGETGGGLAYQIAYTFHHISQDFSPDDAGELIFQGVSSRASHNDLDNTLEGDATDTLGAHQLSAGLYLGAYHVDVRDTSLVFPVDASGNQASSVPVIVDTAARATNVVLGVYAGDLWRLSDRARVNVGLRLDSLTGFTKRLQIDPTVNVAYDLDNRTTVHVGLARYMQAPSYQGISPGAPAAFTGTTGNSGEGAVSPLAEDDVEIDAGLVTRLSDHVTLSEDNFYERTFHYLDTGQFGVVPIFAPFNYGRGYMWGSELALKYRDRSLSAYANLTLGRNNQKGVATGQFNFDSTELAFIDTHEIVLDHQPLVGVSSGFAYDWRDWQVSVDAIYSSGLRGGFADQTRLPQVFQVNAAIQRSFKVSRLGKVIDRLAIVNIFDRTNLIRPAEGIGIFQAAYGPRFTVLDSIVIPF